MTGFNFKLLFSMSFTLKKNNLSKAIATTIATFSDVDMLIIVCSIYTSVILILI